MKCSVLRAGKSRRAKCENLIGKKLKHHRLETMSSQSEIIKKHLARCKNARRLRQTVSQQLPEVLKNKRNQQIMKLERKRKGGG